MTDQVHPWPDPSKLMFRKVDRQWSENMLLVQNGWFPLADVMKLLDRKNCGKYRKTLVQKDKMIRENGDYTAIMGLKQYGNRIWANMPVFSKWYANNESMQIHFIPKHWDLQTFLQQKNGIFSLKGVFQLLPKEWPIQYPAMRNLIRKRKDPRGEIGADKLEGANYVVFMPKFGEWIQKQMS